jgi:hydroxymethylglutaryl-CoA reductase
VHPGARLALRILGTSSARELAEIIASVGLAQNLAALRALAGEGIQRGHMALHRKATGQS